MRLFLCLLIISFSFLSFGNTESNAVISGQVIDSLSNKPVEYATVGIFNKSDSKLVNGTVTDSTGIFSLKNMESGVYYIEITFIGYEKRTLKEIEIKQGNAKINVGQIKLKRAIQSLKSTEIVADKPWVEYKIDKKVVNVGRELTAASGTAVDVLQNVPSVSVDIEGNVSLRGSSGFKVLIDGRPSELDANDALKQIPANAIENIEIITNPSAKHDPEGTSGIINVIMKKDKVQGFNGVITVGAGLYENYNSNLLLNYRKKRFNFFINGDYNQSRNPETKTTESRTTTNDTTIFVRSDGSSNRGRTPYNINGGVEYSINAANLISVGVKYGHFGHLRGSSLNYEEWTSPADYHYQYKSEEESDMDVYFYSYNVNYQHKFKKKGHEIYGKFLSGKRDKKGTSTDWLYGTNDAVTQGHKNIENGPINFTELQIDYTLPIREKGKFEAGCQSRLRQSEDDTKTYFFDTTTNVFDYQIKYSHIVDYKQNIHAIYAIYANETKKLGYQFGLRGEYTDHAVELADSNQTFVIDRMDYFPTLHISYNLPKNQQFMISATRRIERPRPWDFEPFVTWTDAYNVSRGNPTIKPEYIQSYEMGYQKKFGSNFVSLETYYRVTNNKIERVKSVYTENVILNSHENVGKDYALGSELMIGFDWLKWWHIDLSGNVFDYRIEGELNGIDYAKKSFNWGGRFNNNLKLKKDIQLQFNAQYQGPTATSQGKMEGFFMANAAIKKDFINKKLSATIQVRDIFGTGMHSNTYEGDGFYLYSKSDFKSPVFSFMLSYKFNNFKTERLPKSLEEDIGGDDF